MEDKADEIDGRNRRKQILKLLNEQGRTAEEVYNNVTNGLRDTISNVILMHDFNGNNKTLEALPSIIKYALDNGYTFEKITNKTPMVTQNVQN